MGWESVEGAVLAVTGSLGPHGVDIVPVTQELRRGGGGQTADQGRAGGHQTGGVTVTSRGEHGACNDYSERYVDNI